MNWVFQYGREWTSPSKIKADCYWPYYCYWLIQVLENGSFLVSGPVKKQEEFSTLQRAKDFCEMHESMILTNRRCLESSTHYDI